MYFDDNDFLLEEESETKKERQHSSALEMKRVLMNAIKMQALYSDGRLKIVETSDMIN